jgi:hypothetical protein
MVRCSMDGRGLVREDMERADMVGADVERRRMVLWHVGGFRWSHGALCRSLGKHAVGNVTWQRGGRRGVVLYESGP